MTEEPSDPRVAAAVDRLDELAAKDPAEHVEIYEHVHRDLQDALADAAEEQTSATAEEQGPATAEEQTLATAEDPDADPGGPPS